MKVLIVSCAWITLECQSSCQLSTYDSYIWYGNGKKIPGKTSATWSGFYEAESNFSCAFEGQEEFVSPPVCKFLHTQTHNAASPCQQLTKGWGMVIGHNRDLSNTFYTFSL